MKGRTEFRVLGPVEVRVGDRVNVVSGRMQRTLLGTLLARSNQLVTVDVLTDALWAGSRDPRAVRKLQVHVHRLRGVLDDPDRLSFNAVGYELRAAADEVDAGRFDVLLDTGLAAVSHEPQRAIDSLRAALALWRGTPFADLEVRPLTDWSRRLIEQRLTATEALYQAQLNAGLHEAILGELTDFLAGHPLRERAHLLLMTALYHAGRRAEALDVYRRARHTLVSELGLEPGHEMRELHRRVLDGAPPAPRDSARPGIREVPSQLPADVHDFAGRHEELNELDGLVPDEVPVTISVVTGTAGVGKTALAVRWAHRARDRFPDGELYVDLRGYGPDTLVSPSDALAGILRALGVEGAAIPEALAERAARFRSFVDGRRMLLLLDNARTAEQVRPLLPGTPSCFTVVTSRESLTGLVARDGAHRIRLHRLPPADAVSLVHGLLGSRADDQLAAVGILVERCARLPLALRIAAEQMRSRPDRAVCELGDELIERQNALDLLDVDGDPQTAVRAVFSWSYCQLEPAVARVFRLLGVHPGQDIDAHAAAAMARADLRDTGRALDVLVRAHLVDHSPARRYQPHDLLRAYATELAEATDHPAERADALAGLRGYYLAAAAAAMDTTAPNETRRRPEVAPPATGVPVFDSYDSAFSWLNHERANLLAVTQHADAGYVVAMSQTIWRYLSSGKYHDDAVSLHTRALEACRCLGDLPAQADTHRVLAGALFRVGLISEAVNQLEQAMRLYEELGDRSLRAATLNNLGIVQWRRGKLSSAEDHFRQAIALYRACGDLHMQAPAKNNLGRILSTRGNYAEAHVLHEQALAAARGNGDRAVEASALCNLGRVHIATGQLEQALHHTRSALAVAQDTGHRVSEGAAQRLLGVAHRALGNHQHAVHLLDSAVEIARAVGDTDDLMAALNERAATAVSTGDLADARSLYQEVLSIENGHQDECAHAHAGLATIHADQGDHHHARDHRHQALALYQRLGMPQADTIAASLRRPTTGRSAAGR